MPGSRNTLDRDKQQRFHLLGHDYWWLKGKYNIVDYFIRFINRADTETTSVLCDVGCGPGNMLGYLSQYGQVFGCDSSLEPLAVCRERQYLNVVQGDICNLPLHSNSFDTITAVDVVEHIEDDEAALRELYRVTKAGGCCVITVPAFELLWGQHDELYGHVRRYRVPDLRSKLELVGFSIIKITYIQSLFFLPLLIFRYAKRLLLKEGGPDDFVKFPPFLNSMMTSVITAEAVVLKRVNLPVGVGILAIAKKAPSA